MSLRLGIAGLFAIAILVGCASSHTAPRSVITTGPDRLRTFTWVTEEDGGPVGCPAFAAAHPVSGVLRGDPNDPQEPVWLEGQAGTRLSIVWPAGFTVTFEPDGVLRDEKAAIVARAGDRVELGQVDALAKAGTFGDPYIASGLVFNGCYVYTP